MIAKRIVLFVRTAKYVLSGSANKNTRAIHRQVLCKHTHACGRTAVPEQVRISSQAPTRTDYHCPDHADYFLVQIFVDPFYGVPMFYTSGGASSCHHEAGTAWRSKPKIEITYLGPDTLAPSDPALFQVKLSNEIPYYDSGPAPGKRPQWAANDLGYNLPIFALASTPQSIKDGLSITVDGNNLMGPLEMGDFATGSNFIEVAVHRGPQKYTYEAPELQFTEACDDKNGGTAALTMEAAAGSSAKEIRPVSSRTV